MIERARLGPAAGLAAAVAVAAGLALAGGAAGCSGDCCTIDSFPIVLESAPLGVGAGGQPGGLLAWAQSPTLNGGAPFRMSVDTASPLTVSSGSADGSPETVSRSFDILGATAADMLGAAATRPVRARFHDIDMLPVAIGTVGDAATQPVAVFGGDLLRGFSVEFRFSQPSMTFWPNQRADDGFLEDVGYAVIHFTPFGGGELDATGPADVLGLQGPVDVAPSRIVLRACGAPDLFAPETSPRQACCRRGDEISDSSGTPLSLLLATGAGPMVLTRSAWTRMLPGLSPIPAETPGKLYLVEASPPLDVAWTTLPEAAHIALVNQESSASADPGPCVELARSRRIEWVAYRQAKLAAQAVCVQPCDTDPNDPGKAQNSAAYIELGGDATNPIPVAIVADTDPYFEGLRADIRPEGPELDGIIGAGVLSRARVEIDYRSSSMRAIFSCDGETNRQTLLDRRALPAVARSVGAARLLQPAVRGAAPDVCRRHVRRKLSGHAGGDVTVPDAGGRAAAGAGSAPAAAAAGPLAAFAGSRAGQGAGRRSPTSRSRGARRRRWRCSCKTGSCSGWCAPACRWSIRSTPAAGWSPSRSWRAAIRRPA